VLEIILKKTHLKSLQKQKAIQKVRTSSPSKGIVRFRFILEISGQGQILALAWAILQAQVLCFYVVAFSLGSGPTLLSWRDRRC